MYDNEYYFWYKISVLWLVGSTSRASPQILMLGSYSWYWAVRHSIVGSMNAGLLCNMNHSSHSELCSSLSCPYLSVTFLKPVRIRSAWTTQITEPDTLTPTAKTYSDKLALSYSWTSCPHLLSLLIQLRASRAYCSISHPHHTLKSSSLSIVLIHSIILSLILFWHECSSIQFHCKLLSSAWQIVLSNWGSVIILKKKKKYTENLFE